MASSKYDGMPILDGNGKLIHRMTPAERAKIFVPFDPLKGFQEALWEKEREAALIDARNRADAPFEDDLDSGSAERAPHDDLPE